MPEPIDGLLLVDKAAGMTSHDVVQHVRRRFKLKKVGHCGTLDPSATGLLMLVIGKATKVQDLLMSEDKVYLGQLTLGITTNTQDADGEVLDSADDLSSITETEIRKAFENFQGDFYQTPPMVSAVKKDGVPLYKLARKGIEVEREPRLVTVYRHDIAAIHLPRVDFEILCSKGFYVRTYCHDIGNQLGCGGHLSRLRRTKSGNFSVDDAISWEELNTAASLSSLEPYLLSLPAISRIRRQ
jgi:tRNA pseudouridine55 synthase